ncbi:MAG TPA: hypothetical protein VFS20_26450, partial [Longimicrobium sp.]|nr:hypothetical protein [Longimicrobium sp.]
MVYREFIHRPLSRAVFGLLVLGGCGTETPHPELGSGSPAPPALAASEEGAVRATWVFAGGDLLRCRSSARELRHLQARFGDRLEVAAIAFDADRKAVESFLRYQRVHAHVRYVTNNDAAEAEGLVVPALYLARGRRIATVYPGVPLDDS